MKNKQRLVASILLAMRITIAQIAITIVFASSLYAKEANSQNVLQKTFTLSVENKQLRKVITEIQKQTGVHFSYSSNAIDAGRPLSFAANNKTIADFLSEILVPHAIGYEVIEDKIVLFPATWSQPKIIETVDNSVPEKIVTGRVMDEKGTPVQGVTVSVKGKKVAVITNDKGNFSIKVDDDNAILVFSSVEFETVEMEASKISANIPIVLKGKVGELQGVVVTALGIKRSEKALGYAVQKISGENLQKVAGVDVGTSLTGKVAGLLVKNSSDFASVPSITIRGESPLIVIDGVPYTNKTISDISAEDIESISVLKGATASALYGFRGANGAIMITTKKAGENKSGLSVDFTTNTMYTAGFLAIPKKQSVYGRGSNNTYNINSDASWGTTMDGKTETQWDPFEKVFKPMPYLPVGKNNFKNFLEQGYVTNNNLSIGYTKGNVSLRNSLNWIQNKGQYPNSTLNKYTYSFGVDLNLDKFKMSTDFSYAKKASPNVGMNGYTSYDPMYTLLIWSSPDFNILDYKNNYWITKGIQQNYTYGLQPNGSYTGASENNPYFNQYEKTNEINRDIFNVDMSMSYKIADWLSATLRNGVDFYKEVGQLRVSKGSYVSTGNTAVPGNLYTWVGTTTGAYTIGQSSGFSVNSDLLLTGERSYKKFRFEYLAGGALNFLRNDVLYASTNGGISIPGFFSIAASVTSPTVSQSLARQQINSVYGRLSVGWNKLVYVEATGRNDWSSTLSATQRSYFYPSLSGSFILSELMPGTKSWLDLWKLRSSYTIAKNIPGIYAINSTYTINNATWNTLNGASVPSSLYPNDITPSASNTYEIGTQAVAYKNRIMLDISYYDKKLYNGIITGSITPASGYSGVYTNSKEVTHRRGWEVVLNGTPVQHKDLQLDIALNWSTYKRVYTTLDPIYSAKQPWIQPGKRVDVLYSKDFLRNPADGQLIFNNGRLVYSSYNTVFGYTDPDWIWGANGNLRYKNFSLYMSLDGVVGGVMNTRTESYLWQSGNHPNSLTPERAADVADPTTPHFLGQGVKVVSGSVTYDSYGNITSDTRTYAPNDVKTTYRQYVIDLHNSSAWGGNGSIADTYSKTFFKLREISISYNIPSRYLHRVAKAASVSLIGQNVLLKAKDFKYSDPDGGTEDFADPAVRYLGFKINLSL
ncbi:MAG: SusC/RagA family TonB-linked outer membrane protein [Bacteroidetes bacterium]|nr:SusC/RagA family TonB-linked outer membrane protein [Bacteroidota bacterium]